MFSRLRDYSEDMTIGQNGPFPHYTVAVRQYLDQNIHYSWIRRATPNPWLQRLPYLTYYDIVLWRHLKDFVLHEPPTTVGEL